MRVMTLAVPFAAQIASSRRVLLNEPVPEFPKGRETLEIKKIG